MPLLLLSLYSDKLQMYPYGIPYGMIIFSPYGCVRLWETCDSLWFAYLLLPIPLFLFSFILPMALHYTWAHEHLPSQPACLHKSLSFLGKGVKLVESQGV